MDESIRLKFEIIKLRAALRALLLVTDQTTAMLEDESPGLKECGYWSPDEKQAYEMAKEMVNTGTMKAW